MGMMYQTLIKWGKITKSFVPIMVKFVYLLAACLD